MDATRQRRCKSSAHQQWYAYWRLIRFAHHLGFGNQASRAAAGGFLARPVPATTLAHAWIEGGVKPLVPDYRTRFRGM